MRHKIMLDLRGLSLQTILFGEYRSTLFGARQYFKSGLHPKKHVTYVFEG